MLLFINTKNNHVFYRENHIQLTMKEYEMLAFLIRNARKNIKYSELVSEVWRGREQGVTLNAVSQVAYRLRDKMKTIKIPMTIKISLKNNCEIIHGKRIMVFIKGGGLLQCRVFFI